VTAAAACLTFALVAAAGAAAQRPALTGGAQLARAYDAVMDARFEDLPGLLAGTCPPAAPEACRLMEVVGLWWQIQLDPHNTSRDAAFQAGADAAIDAAEAWAARDRMKAEAWFYLGGAYGARAQWRALRGQQLAAARDGKRIKEALEQAIALDPALQDAYFGIGLYRYYAAVAPAAARMLRWLLLLPGGNRTEGLAQMLRTRAEGQILVSEADYQLALISLWYEKNPQRSLDLLRGLSARHPRNPHFPQLIAEIEDANLGNPQASLRTWQTLLEAALEGRVARPALAETRARLGIAQQLDRLDDAAGALVHLRAVIASKPDAPYGALAQAHQQHGRVLERMGMRDAAIVAYREALATLPPGDRTRIGDRTRAALRGTRR
jgi:tetratricopeptide (TPR) repeat protein